MILYKVDITSRNRWHDRETRSLRFSNDCSIEQEVAAILNETSILFQVFQGLYNMYTYLD